MDKRVQQIPNWPTILDCIRAGIEGKPDQVRDYAQLLLEKMQTDGQEQFARHLQKILTGEKGMLIGIPEK